MGNRMQLYNSLMLWLEKLQLSSLGQFALLCFLSVVINGEAIRFGMNRDAAYHAG
jgi:hypothetical protein